MLDKSIPYKDILMKFVNEYADAMSILKDYLSTEYYETFINTAK